MTKNERVSKEHNWKIHNKYIRNVISCNDCGKVIKAKKYFKEHIWKIHKRHIEMGYSCGDGKKTFETKNELRKHTMRKHKRISFETIGGLIKDHPSGR